MHPPSNARPPAANPRKTRHTHHEVVALRAGGPSGRTSASRREYTTRHAAPEVSMNRLSPLSVALLLTSPLCFAQNPAQPAIVTVTTSSDCQVTMRATPDHRLTAVDRDHPAGYRLHLSLSNLQPTAIVSAEVTIHGSSAKGCFSQANSGQSNCADLKKTIDLHLKIAPSAEASTDLTLPTDFTAVSLIDLSTVTYANGTTWHSSPTKTCHAAPTGATLISTR